MASESGRGVVFWPLSRSGIGCRGICFGVFLSGSRSMTCFRLDCIRGLVLPVRNPRFLRVVRLSFVSVILRLSGSQKMTLLGVVSALLQYCSSLLGEVIRDRSVRAPEMGCLRDARSLHLVRRLLCRLRGRAVRVSSSRLRVSRSSVQYLFFWASAHFKNFVSSWLGVLCGRAVRGL